MLLLLVVRLSNRPDNWLLNTFRKAGNPFGVAPFGVLIAGGTVAGIQHAIMLSELLLLLASGIAVAGIRHGSGGVKDD